MHRGRYAAVVERSLAVMHVCCKLCVPLENVGCAFLAQKRVHTDAEEVGAAKEYIRRLGEKQEGMGEPWSCQ